MKREALEFLRSQEGDMSGQELSKLLDVPDILSEAEVLSRIHSKWAGKQIHVFKEVDSTNTRAGQLAENGAVHGTVVVAEQQTAGKGRRGRQWSSPAGSGIWMSLILRPLIKPASASMLTLVAALAVNNAIEEMTDCQVQIKWPNDIVLGGKKVCGILTEMSSLADGIQYVVLGMGINVNTTAFPPELCDSATSLYLESGKRYNRTEMICRVMEHFEKAYQRFLETESLSGIIESYTGKLVNLDQPVKVLAPGREYTGVARGVSAQGELLVQLKDGSIRPVMSGEVSVRGIYGYV